MGGSTSKVDNCEFEQREFFQSWRLEHVKEAIARWQALRKHNSFIAKRMLFYQVFTDFGVITSDGTHLALPLEVFATFDRRRRGFVPVLEVFFVLILFCQGDLAEKLLTSFTFFDLQSEGYISHSDLVVLLHNVLSAMYKVGVTTRQPTSDELSQLCTKTLAEFDANVDGQLTLHEFVRWARSQVASQQLLMEYGARQGAKSPLAAATTPAAEPVAVAPAAAVEPETTSPSRRSRRLRRRGHRRRHGTTARSTTAAAGAGAGSGAGAGLERTDSKSTLLPEDVTPTNFYARFLEEADLVDKKAKRLNFNSMTNAKTLRHLASITEFTQVEVKKLAVSFTKRSKTLQYVGGEDFKAILGNHMPGLMADPDLLQRVFKAADVDHDGRISFKEIVILLNRMMRGTLQSRLELVFELFGSAAKDGEEVSMGVADLVRLIQQGNKVLDRIVKHASDIMESFDEDGSGSISMEEFEAVLEKFPKWMDAFASLVIVPPVLARDLHKLVAMHPGISVASLELILARMRHGELDVITNVESKDQFLDLVVQCFTREAAAFRTILDAAYDTMAASFHPFAMRDALNCWAKVLTADTRKQVHFFFHFMDVDGSGELDRHEIMHMLLTAKKNIASQAKLIIDLLVSLDEDGDGTISLSELKTSAQRQPLVLSSLDNLFLVNRHSETGIQPQKLRMDVRWKSSPKRSRKAKPGSVVDEKRRRALLGRYAVPDEPDRQRWQRPGKGHWDTTVTKAPRKTSGAGRPNTSHGPARRLSPSAPRPKSSQESRSTAAAPADAARMEASGDAAPAGDSAHGHHAHHAHHVHHAGLKRVPSVALKHVPSVATLHAYVEPQPGLSRKESKVLLSKLASKPSSPDVLHDTHKNLKKNNLGSAPGAAPATRAGRRPGWKDHMHREDDNVLAWSPIKVQRGPNPQIARGRPVRLQRLKGIKERGKPKKSAWR